MSVAVSVKKTISVPKKQERPASEPIASKVPELGKRKREAVKVATTLPLPDKDVEEPLSKSIKVAEDLPSKRLKVAKDLPSERQVKSAPPQSSISDVLAAMKEMREMESRRAAQEKQREEEWERRFAEVKKIHQHQSHPYKEDVEEIKRCHEAALEQKGAVESAWIALAKVCDLSVIRAEMT